jgi:hypothetical protein
MKSYFILRQHTDIKTSCLGTVVCVLGGVGFRHCAGSFPVPSAVWCIEIAEPLLLYARVWGIEIVKPLWLLNFNTPHLRAYSKSVSTISIPHTSENAVKVAPQFQYPTPEHTVKVAPQFVEIVKPLLLHARRCEVLKLWSHFYCILGGVGY